eukprot:scaffold44690_cov51-Phaeocystis_antarctica.AAC.2
MGSMRPWCPPTMPCALPRGLKVPRGLLVPWLPRARLVRVRVRVRVGVRVKARVRVRVRVSG